MSDFAEKRRREMFERLRYILGEKRFSKFMEMAESGELAKQRQRFFEMLESDESQQYLKPFEFNKDFLGYSN